MKKSVVMLIIFAVLVASCNFGPVAPVTDATPDLVATQVNILLTKTNVAIQATETMAVVAATKLATLQPTQAQTATATATLTPAASPSPTKAVPTLTPTPEDFKASLGKPTWEDKFDSATAWGLQSPYDDGNTKVSISGNKLNFTSYKATGWHGWRLRYTKVLNFYFEASINTNTCAGTDLYGLVFRSPDNTAGYWFGVTCDGKYNLRKGDVSNFANVIVTKASTEIKAGSNQTNRLGVMIVGSKIGLYINGKLIEEVTDTTYTKEGTYGAFIAGKATTNFTVNITNMAYWAK